MSAVGLLPLVKQVFTEVIESDEHSCKHFMLTTRHGVGGDHVNNLPRFNQLRSKSRHKYDAIMKVAHEIYETRYDDLYDTKYRHALIVALSRVMKSEVETAPREKRV